MGADGKQEPHPQKMPEQKRRRGQDWQKRVSFVHALDQALFLAVGKFIGLNASNAGNLNPARLLPRVALEVNCGWPLDGCKQ